MSYNQSEYLYEDRSKVMVKPSQNGGEDITEKSRLQQPVQLQPSWEASNLPEDELNFKSLTMQDASLQVNAPPDRQHLVYLTFLLHGIGVLMPWNMLLNADSYFINYKLANFYIGYTFPYLTNFIQIMTFCAQVPNVTFNWMNVFIRFGGSLTKRIVWSITIEVIIFIITIILAMMDSSKWPYPFFYITMILIVFLNVANGVYQNTIYGMAAKLPPKYTGAVVLGSNISGTFTTVVYILTKMFSANEYRIAAIYYFISALFILLICFDTYFALPLNKFYRHHELIQKKQEQQRKHIDPNKNEKIPYLHILKQAAPQFYNVFFTLFVTLAVFPSITSNVLPITTEFLGPYFPSVTCYLTFNVTAMFGSFVAGFIQWPKPRFLFIPVTLRIFYIPFFLFCNYQLTNVNRIFPVLIKEDWVFWAISLTMGFTSGYFSSLAMMYAPRMVEERYTSTAGMCGAAFLITGIFGGIVISFLWPWIIAHVGY